MRLRIAVFVGLLGVGCVPSARAPKGSIEAHQLVKDWVTAINAGKGLEAIDRFIAPNYVWHLPGKDHRGRAAVKEVFAQVFRQCPAFRLTPDEVVTEKDRVVVRWTIGCTQDSPPAASITIDRFADGQFLEGWEMNAEKGWLGPQPPG